MPAPLSRDVCNAIIDDILAGILGRNAIARKHHVSPGTVSKLARIEGAQFEKGWMTSAGSEAHRVDCAVARLEREAELWNDFVALPQTTRQRDGRETKAYRRLSYELYDLQRHHR